MDDIELLEKNRVYTKKRSIFTGNGSEIEAWHYIPNHARNGEDIISVAFTGFNTILDDYDPFAINFVKGGFEIYVMSSRGHMGSTGTPSLKLSKDDSMGVFKKMAKVYERICVVGSSLGGTVSLRPALESDCVGAICLVCVPDVLSVEKYWEYFEGDRDLNFRFSPEDRDSVGKEIENEPPLTTQLDDVEITKPVLVMYAGNDVIVPLADSERLLNALEGLAVDEGMVESENFWEEGHKMQDTNRVSSSMLDFFNRHIVYP